MIMNKDEYCIILYTLNMYSSPFHIQNNLYAIASPRWCRVTVVTLVLHLTVLGLPSNTSRQCAKAAVPNALLAAATLFPDGRTLQFQHVSAYKAGFKYDHWCCDLRWMFVSNYTVSIMTESFSYDHYCISSQIAGLALYDMSVTCSQLITVSSK